MNGKIYIFDRDAKMNPVYSTWLDQLEMRELNYEVVSAMPSTWSVPMDASLVVTHQHYQWEHIATLRKVLEANHVPILILSDGILEFRNSFNNPGISPGSVFTPLFGHKLACLGRAPARQLEAMGNGGKCEVVGHPRFDQLAQLPPVPAQAEGPFRLLVTSARTPAFDEVQQQAVLKGFQDLANRVHRNPDVGHRSLQVQWRLTDSILDSLDLPTSSILGISGTLTDAIDRSDAVITTPSTVYLESCIRRRPTALIDYTHSPAYVPSAWNINSQAQINPVLEQLAQPPEARMLFQRTHLADQVELKGSEPRLLKLIEVMIEYGELARKNNTPLRFPDRILALRGSSIAPVDEELDLSNLFTNSTAHQIDRVALLQQELAQAITALDQMPRMIHERNEVIERKSRHIDNLNEMFQEQVAEIKHLRAKVRLLESRQTIEEYKQEAKRLVEKLNALIQMEEEFNLDRQGAANLKIYRAG